MDHCIFCDIVAGAGAASVVWRDDLCTAFMDIQPVNTGHVLVIPNQHASCLAELDPEAGAHVFVIAQQVAAALRKSDLPCEGVNLFLADGKAAGQDVFHVHVHVIPRYRGDGFGLLFGPRYGQRPERTQLDALAQQIGGQL